MTVSILYAYAAIMPFKVLNMILGSGVLRSGGKTAFVMAIDLIGTWIFGIPLGLISAFIFHWPVAMVYFALSLEECIRFAISLLVFKQGRWMYQLQA